jgi:hypothetical protein
MLKNLWDASKKDAQAARPPKIVGVEAKPRVIGSSPETPPEYQRLDPNTFGFAPSSRLYQKVSVLFFVDVNPDQVPLRSLHVDWDDGESRRSIFTNEPEGKGKNPRSAGIPYQFTHIYKSSPVGKKICVYAMDNWSAETQVCGTIARNSDGGLFIKPKP